jgi:propanol-preferring alcohol dehydrogenase
MRAVQLVGWQREAELVETARPAPGPGEVLLQIHATGLCHSDLHLMEWPEGTLPYDLPFTLGHESAGTVAELGPGASGVAVGDRVLVYGPWGCTTCWSCSQGKENLCEHTAERRAHGAGLGRNGGLADFMVVPSSRYLVPIGGLDPVEAAPLTDAALTPYHAIKRSSQQLRPNATAVVIGVGGLGHIAIQILRALTGVRVVAVDLRDEALALALDSGAHSAVDGRSLDPADLREEIAGAGAALVLDFVGTDATLELAAGVAGQGGDIAIVGIAGGTLPAGFGRIPLECSIAIPNWGTLPELIEVVALAQSGAIHAEVERVPLDATLDAYRRLERGEVVGRAVVVP